MTENRDKKKNKGKNKGKKKGKKRPGDLKLILASVETLTAEIIKLAEEFDAFKLDPKRRISTAPPGPKSEMVSEEPTQPQAPRDRRIQAAKKKKAGSIKVPIKKTAGNKSERKKNTTKKKATKKTVTRKVSTKKTAGKKAARKKTTTKKKARKKTVTRKVPTNKSAKHRMTS